MNSQKFKVGDRVRWSARAIAEGMGAEKGALGPFVVLAVDSIPSAQLQGVPSAGDSSGWFHFNWLELVPPAPALIDASKTYRTRDGREVPRILAVDVPGPNPVAAIVKEANGAYSQVLRRADGTGPSRGCDLIEVKPEREGWINVYPWGARAWGAGAVYESRKDADSAAMDDRIACIPVSFREGEGL